MKSEQGFAEEKMGCLPERQVSDIMKRNGIRQIPDQLKEVLEQLHDRNAKSGEVETLIGEVENE